MQTPAPAEQTLAGRLPPWLWVLLGTLALRLWPLLSFGNSPFLIPDDGDMAFYHQWAMRALQGGLTDGQAFYGLPGYPFLLALLYRTLGLNFLIISLLQFLLDAITGVIIFAISNRTLAAFPLQQGSRWLHATTSALPYSAAFGWALFQPSQAFSLILMPTAWTLCFYWAAIGLVVRWHGKLHSMRALALGCATGACSMLVATVFAFIPLAAGAILFAPMKWRSRLASIALLLLGALLGSSPCWLYNRFIAGEPVFLSAHSGLNMYVGNHPLANGYTRLPPELGSTQAGMLRDSILVAQKSAGRPLTRAEVSNFWANKARTWIAQNRPAWAALTLKKAANFWNAFEYDDLSALTIFRENRILTPGLTFGTVALLGLPGLLLALLRGPYAARLAAFGVLAHMAVLLPVFITERYRLAAAPGLLVLSAYFLAWLATSAHHRHLPRMALAAALLPASALLVFWPRDPALANHDLYNSGRAALAAGQLNLAESKLTQAATANPDNAEIQFSLGNLRLAQGDRYKAKLHYRRTLELDASHDRAWNNLAVLALEENHLDLALQFISHSITLFPEDAKSHYIKATILEKLARFDDALTSASQACKLDPNQPAFQQLLNRLQIEKNNFHQQQKNN